MTKLLLILTIIILSSCDKTDNIVKRDLPIEVVNLKEVNKYDTLLSIQTSDKVYYFDKKEEYIGVINKQDDSGSAILSAFIFFTVIAFAFGLLINS